MLPDRCMEMYLLSFQAMGTHKDSPANNEMCIEMVAGNMQSLPLDGGQR